MDITVTPSAADTGTLRVWLRRVPVSSDTVYAFRVASDGTVGKAIGYANVYGRGPGSTASERFMLLFRITGDGQGEPQLRTGEILRLQVRNPADDGYEDAELDVLFVE